MSELKKISKNDLSKISLNFEQIKTILDMTTLNIEDLIKRYPKINNEIRSTYHTRFKKLKLSNPIIK